MTTDSYDQNTVVRRLDQLLAGHTRFEEKLAEHRSESRDSAERLRLQVEEKLNAHRAEAQRSAEILGQKIDSVRVTVDRVTEEVYVGRENRQPLLVRVAQMERKHSPAHGLPAVQYPPTTAPSAPRQPMPSSAEDTGPHPQVTLSAHGVERWKIVAGVIIAVITTAAGVATALLAR